MTFCEEVKHWLEFFNKLNTVFNTLTHNCWLYTVLSCNDHLLLLHHWFWPQCPTFGCNTSINLKVLPYKWLEQWFVLQSTNGGHFSVWEWTHIFIVKSCINFSGNKPRLSIMPFTHSQQTGRCRLAASQNSQIKTNFKTCNYSFKVCPDSMQPPHMEKIIVWM